MGVSGLKVASTGLVVLRITTPSKSNTNAFTEQVLMFVSKLAIADDKF